MPDSPFSYDDVYVKWSRYYGSSMFKGFDDIKQSSTKFSSFAKRSKFSLFLNPKVYERSLNYNTVLKRWEVWGVRGERTSTIGFIKKFFLS